MWQKIINYLDERIGCESFVQDKLKGYKVPKETNILYTLGIVSLVAYMVQAVSGYFLLVYYIPHPDYAFKSVQEIMNSVPFGWLLRMIHIVVSNLMVVVVTLHLISIFMLLAYKKPRELTWVAGVCLLLITLIFCLSGYLLPWSQRSFWATTIVTNIPTAFPVAGDYIANLLRGGELVTGTTLSRFFALHVAFLPPIFLSIVGFHVFLVKHLGFSASPLNTQGEKMTEGYPFYPYFLLKQVFMIMVFFATVFFVITFMPTFFIPEAANTPADPFKTPISIKPEWYFLAPYQMFKIIPNKFFGISMQILLTVVFLLWPFLETKNEKNIFKRPFLLALLIVAVIMWLSLTVWGKYS
ncbi:MAG: cytochrome bc complex cytochrome b subunit [Nitrospirae bacterium]|nr:cytochrome bc complex cytochrome b subunit [Nitrospirota bacterium]